MNGKKREKIQRTRQESGKKRRTKIRCLESNAFPPGLEHQKKEEGLTATDEGYVSKARLI